MSKNLVMGVGAIGIAAVGAWALGLFGGGGLSAEAVKERLDTRAKAAVDTLVGGDSIGPDDFTQIRRVQNRDGTLNHKVYLQTDDSTSLPDDQLAKTTEVLTKFACGDADAAELIASGVTFVYEVSARDDKEVGKVEVKECPAA